MTPLLGVIAALTSVPAVLSVPPNAAELLERIERAHSDIPAIECRYDIGSACEGPDGAKVRSMLDMAPRVRMWNDPRTGGTYRLWHSVRAMYDGTGRWRVETEDLTCVGPRDLSIGVILRTPEMHAQAIALKSNFANLAPAREFLNLSSVELRRRRIVSAEELVAREGYPTLVSWSTRMLRQADDLAALEDEHGPGVHSASLGIEVWADPESGEVTGVRIANDRIGPNAWWFDGRFDEPLFPARHPRLIRFGAPAAGMATEVDGARHIYHEVRAVSFDPALFVTSNLAQRFIDAQTLARVDAQGQPLPPASRAPSGPLPATTSARAAEVAGSVDKVPRSMIAAGLACLLAAGIIWWRRRSA